MKKSILMLLVALTISTLAQAEETYIVKANGSLAQIAKKYGLTWQQILAANPEISDPTLIRTGQELRIPEAGVFLWKNPGGDPFGKKDFRKAIKMFSLPDSVKANLIAQVESGEAENKNYYINQGDCFSQMVFDNYRLVNNVVAAWPDSTAYGAKRYSCQTDSLVYYLIAPRICNNWAWWQEKVVAPKAVEVKKVVEVEKEKKPTPPVVKPTPPLAKPPEAGRPFVRRSETYLWTGHYFPLRGAGGGNYYGGKSNFFFSTKGAFLGKFHLGVGAIANGWEGRSGSGFSYEGYRITVGPVLDMTRAGFRFTSSAQYGQQHDQGRDGKGYRAEQATDIVYSGLTFDSYGDGSQLYKSRRFESWLDFNIDVGHEKDSRWLSYPIPESSDPAGNKSSASFGGRFYLGHLKSFKTGLVTKANYAWEDGGITSIVGFVVSSGEDIAKVGVEFKNTSSSKYSDANGNSIGVTLDFEPQKRILKWR